MNVIIDKQKLLIGIVTHQCGQNELESLVDRLIGVYREG